MCLWPCKGMGGCVPICEHRLLSQISHILSTKGCFFLVCSTPEHSGEFSVHLESWPITRLLVKSFGTGEGYRIGNHTEGELGFPGSARGKEPASQCRWHKRGGFDPWVGKIPWKKAWQPTPVFLPGEFHGQGSLVDYSPCSRRIGHDGSNLACMHMHAQENWLQGSSWTRPPRLSPRETPGQIGAQLLKHPQHGPLPQVQGVTAFKDTTLTHILPPELFRPVLICPFHSCFVSSAFFPDLVLFWLQFFITLRGSTTQLQIGHLSFSSLRSTHCPHPACLPLMPPTAPRPPIFTRLCLPVSQVKTTVAGCPNSTELWVLSNLCQSNKASVQRGDVSLSEAVVSPRGGIKPRLTA